MYLHHELEAQGMITFAEDKIFHIGKKGSRHIYENHQRQKNGFLIIEKTFFYRCLMISRKVHQFSMILGVKRT